MMNKKNIYDSYKGHLFYILSEEGAWQMEIDNKWCLTMYGHDWTASITSQLECQALCLQTSNCVGISYSYRAGMMNSCFICKNDVLDQNDYGFAFYRKPGKNNYIGNPPNTHFI